MNNIVRPPMLRSWTCSVATLNAAGATGVSLFPAGCSNSLFNANNTTEVCVLYGMGGVITAGVSGTTFTFSVLDAVSGTEYYTIKKTVAASTSESFYIAFSGGIVLGRLFDTSAYSGLGLNANMIAPPDGALPEPTVEDTISVACTGSNSPTGRIFIHYGSCGINEV